MKKKMMAAVLATMLVGTTACANGAKEENTTKETTSVQASSEVQTVETTVQESVVTEATEVATQETEATATEEQASESADIAGVYQYTFEEEIGGEVVSYDQFVILNDDQTGYMIIQDTVSVTWDSETINTGSSSYTYECDGNELTLNMDDFETVFTKMDGEYPDEVKELYTGAN